MAHLTRRLVSKRIGQAIFDHQAAEYRAKRREKHNEITHLIAKKDAEVREYEDIEKQLTEIEKKSEMGKNDKKNIELKMQESQKKLKDQLIKMKLFDPRDLGEEFVDPVWEALHKGEMTLEGFMKEMKKIKV